MAVGSLNVELMLDTSDMIAALRESQERLALVGFAAYEVIKHWEPIKKFFADLWQGITDAFKGAVNIMIDGMNWLIDGLNKLSIDVPGWVPESLGGGQTWGVNIPEIPKLATGGSITKSGYAIVGEEGPELAYFNAGVGVVSNDNFVDMMGRSSKQVVEHTGTITVKGVNDKNQLAGVVDIVISKLRRETRI
ncbi:hypothetical protein Dtox_3667 [Desulfofarcimen acetoxidans DSM 771]|uniref:Uncharacterized protein n=1 Tax=Desulfofarcimen acetoxidans (strain ATCC 49208 / DSM 771 / KCTC 5769 / VKM B-1644 / 5575) TaxID=485916 RepID=C8VWL2_DESAS|nr:hypothetical protein [Desulfofarcimen acetoxidans]ACV64376.1 hypothetical protein Dtox_3667 [Desulfofarcimen acetoxidans DSM 771]